MKLFIPLFLVACQQRSTAPKPEIVKKTKTVVETKTKSKAKREKAPIPMEVISADPNISLQGLLQKEKYAQALLPATDWPYTQWKYAKVFTFNFTSYASQTPWEDARSSLRQEISISENHANVAVQLAKRMNGGGIFTKCPFDPHHAVVFYNHQDEEVAYVNICFSCMDSVLWPDYLVQEPPSEKEVEPLDWEDDGSYEDEQNLRKEVLEKWKQFFSLLGADSFPLPSER